MDSLKKGLESMRQAMADLDLDNPLWAALAAIVVTVFFVFLIRLWRSLTNKLSARLQDVGSTRLKPLRFQNLDILSAEDIASLFEDGLKVLYWLGTTVLVLLNLNLVFGIFPATRGFVATVLGILTTAITTLFEEFVAYLPKLAVIVVTALVAYYAVRLARLIFRGLATRRITIKGFYPEWAMPTFGLIRLMIIAVAFVLVLPNLPAAHSPAFRGVSIFVAILVSLGSTAAVANMVAGVVLTYTRAFKIGDLVRIADTLGKVEEKTLFVTRVTTPKNVEIAIPNAMVLANHIINYSSLARREPGLVLHTTVTIGYDVPQDQVRTLLIEAAKATENIEQEPEPFVLVTSLDDFYVSYEINAYTRQARTMPATYSELHGHIVDIFNMAGVEIMSPHYSAIRDGNPLALPKDHLPKNYEPAPFTFKPLEGLLGRKRQD
jgi:small-conductance mechanosensitive channel